MDQVDNPDGFKLIGLNEMTWQDILKKNVFDRVFSIEEPVLQAHALLSVEDRCRDLGKLTDFKTMSAAYKKREKLKSKPIVNISGDNITAFDLTGTGYNNMKCGKWVADDERIYMPTIDPMVNREACKHPVLIIDRFRNLQTDEERIKIAFKRNNSWKEITVVKSVIASTSKIIELANFGLLVTSENAKNLVKYLSDLEAASENDIPLTDSTTKLGWHGNDFIPYDMENIEFDGAKQFSHIYMAVNSVGTKSKWFDEVSQIRKRGRIETKIMLAASFSAPLIEKLGILPFFVDLNGMTEGGKTVALMLAASVWAKPSGDGFIGDFMCTDTNLEVKADMLNNLPVLLDDSAKSDKKITDNFEAVIYNLCSGRGKGRSNKELGLNRTYTWNTVFICNGEQPLIDHMSKGGALNRIIEVPANEKIFMDPSKTAEILKANYGWAGPEFVRCLKEIPIEDLRSEFYEIIEELKDPSKMQKQTQSMACMILADRLINRLIFKDSNTIKISEAAELIVDIESVSDGKRAYEYIMEKVSANGYRFLEECDEDYATAPDRFERWGVLKSDRNEVAIIPTSLKELCDRGGYSKNTLVKWCMRNGLISVGLDGKPTKTGRIPGMPKPMKLYFFKLPNVDDFEVSNNEDAPKFT